MEKDQWKGNDGQGVTQADGQTFCCQGCADDPGAGCTCM
jgi:hypothetical protein